MQAQQTDSDHCPWFGNTKLKKKTKGMREGETVNSRIDPTRVGQIKPLQCLMPWSGWDWCEYLLTSVVKRKVFVVFFFFCSSRDRISFKTAPLCGSSVVFARKQEIGRAAGQERVNTQEGGREDEKALWQPRDRGNAELITNPSPGVRQHIMTPTRRESLLIKVKGDQLSRWLPTNIRGNRMFNGLCTYHRLLSTPSPKLINRTGPC